MSRKKKKTVILGWDEKGVSFESPRNQWASNYSHTIQSIILEGVIWVRAHWHVNLIILLFFFFFFSFSHSLWCSITICGIVHMRCSPFVDKFDFRFFLPVYNPKSTIFSSPQKPWSFLNLNPSFQRF